jgi:hypothetical protein
MHGGQEHLIKSWKVDPKLGRQGFAFMDAKLNIVMWDIVEPHQSQLEYHSLNGAASPRSSGASG